MAQKTIIVYLVLRASLVFEGCTAPRALRTSSIESESVPDESWSSCTTASEEISTEGVANDKKNSLRLGLQSNIEQKFVMNAMLTLLTWIPFKKTQINNHKSPKPCDNCIGETKF